MKTEDNRIVVLIDMDCFYVQVEERENPQNKGKPACVVQYKNWKGGGIISVNYEARAKGITRQMRGDEAKEKCPDCLLYRVPEQRGKADLTKYRDASKEVIDVLSSFGICIERASIDEAYMDITSLVNEKFERKTDTFITSEMLPNTFIVGLQSSEPVERGVDEWLKRLSEEEFNEKNMKLAYAAVLCEKMRSAVLEKTGFRCSAGIASNKMLAKLACGINKPNKQTLMPSESVEEFFKSFPLKKVRHLGGKLGLILREELNCVTMNDVANFTERFLQQRFEVKTGTWLYWYARGVDHEPVNSRRLPKSIGCNKNFTGTAALDTKEKINHWLEELCAEVSERLEKDREVNQRTAKLLTLTVRLDGDIRPYSYTRSIPLLPTYDHKAMAKACLAVMAKENPCKKPNIWDPLITCIGVSASKFVEVTEANSKIDRFFSNKLSKGSGKGKREEEDQTTLQTEKDRKKDESLNGEVGNEPNAPEPCDMQFSDPSTSNIIDELKDDAKFVCSKIILPGDGSASSSDSTLHDDNQNADSSRKLGFFARKVINTTTKNRKMDETAVAEIQISQYQSCGEKTSDGATPLISDSLAVISELFPNLDDIDTNVVELLPLDLQREIYRLMNLRNGTQLGEQNKKLITCNVCQSKILEEEESLHNDYHVAFEMQKQPAKAIETKQPLKSNSNAGSKGVAKRRLNEKKEKEVNAKRSRTIESFFKTPGF